MGVGSLMEPIESALRGDFFPALFGGGELDDDLRELLVSSLLDFILI